MAVPQETLQDEPMPTADDTLNKTQATKRTNSHMTKEREEDTQPRKKSKPSIYAFRTVDIEDWCDKIDQPTPIDQEFDFESILNEEEDLDLQLFT